MMFLLFEFVCGTPPSCLKVRGGGWVSCLQDFSLSPWPLGTYWVFELIGTFLGMGLGWGFGDLGTKGLGPGLE